VGEGRADYAIIDLGEGQNWLTTRLFLFAILMRRVRDLKTFVFLETRAGLKNRYLGLRSPDAVRWLIAREFPWMEVAFAKSYHGLAQLKIVSESGAMDRASVGALCRTFVEEIQAGGREDASWMNGAMVWNSSFQ
jgi:hypothetical protein